MPTKRITMTNIPANAIRDFMLDGDQAATNLRFIGQPSVVTYVINANAVGLEYEVYASGRRVVERAAVPAGGTVGVFPALNEQAEQFAAAAGDILEFKIRETTGVATTDSNLAIAVEPM